MARCYLLAIGAIVLMVHSGQSYVLHENSFDAVKGCLQFDNVPGYDDVQVYFPTSLFRNMERTPTSRVFRIGIVGAHDGHIRFGRSAFPYGYTVVEIVLSGWANTKSAGRLQSRGMDNKANNVLLKEAPTPGLLSDSRPLVFKLEVFDNGLMQLTRDREINPFFEFKYSTPDLRPDYIAFTKWHANMIYFYDCPLKVDSSV